MHLQLTCQHRRERLQRIEGTLEPTGLRCGGQQPEDPVLTGEAERDTSLDPAPDLALGFVTFTLTQSRVLYLSATGDFNKSAARVEGPRPAGVDVRAVVIMEEPDEVSALQLGPTQSESQEVASTVHRAQSRTGVESDLQREMTFFWTYVCIFSCQFARFHTVPGRRPVNLTTNK